MQLQQVSAKILSLCLILVDNKFRSPETYRLLAPKYRTVDCVRVCTYLFRPEKSDLVPKWFSINLVSPVDTTAISKNEVEAFHPRPLTMTRRYFWTFLGLEDLANISSRLGEVRSPDWGVRDPPKPWLGTLNVMTKYCSQ